MNRSTLYTLVTLALMALALALFQRGGALLPALAGGLLFGALALLRPDLSLLFVPLAAPLYLMPAVIPSLRADSTPPIRLPTYEIALLLVLGAAVARWLWRRIPTADRRPPTADRPAAANSRNTQHTIRNTQYAIRYAPHLLFLLAGV